MIDRTRHTLPPPSNAERLAAYTIRLAHEVSDPLELRARYLRGLQIIARLSGQELITVRVQR